MGIYPIVELGWKISISAISIDLQEAARLLANKMDLCYISKLVKDIPYYDDLHIDEMVATVEV